MFPEHVLCELRGRLVARHLAFWYSCTNAKDRHVWEAVGTEFSIAQDWRELQPHGW